MPLDTKKLLDALSGNQVVFVIVGGVAAISHGSTTATFDLDICYARDEDNFKNLSSALLPFHPRLRDADGDLPFKFDVPTIRNGLNFTLSTDVGDLDLLGEVAGVGNFQAVLANSEPLEIFGTSQLFLKLDALIRAKRAAGRRKDLNALPELEALLELQRRQSKS